jgi:hypothetical protein
MEIIDNRGAPPELIRQIHEKAEGCESVKKVIFDAFIEELEGDMGAFDPETGTIIIDMGACLLNKAWTKKGIMLIPNVWFNLLMTAFHEITHAAQLDEELGLSELHGLPKYYEYEATAIAEHMLLDWAKDHTIPTLDELGWVGEQIKILFNRLYAQIPAAVNEEIDLQGTDLAADAVIAATASKEYCAPEEIAQLLKSIDEGLVGGKVGQKKYLTAYEAIDLDCVCNLNKKQEVVV